VSSLSVRRAIEAQIIQLVGARSGAVLKLDDPSGDLGLFGPDSACWKVHGDFTSMMIGGVAALLLQMLHPRALAGVWDHSNFREDMSGRLRGTAQFIAGTTYGSTQQAEAMIARVQAIHDRVLGVLPGGEPYSANDPDLLTWVHVAEVSSFLAAYLRHRDPAFPPAEQDRYYAETALVARRLGATEVPTNRAEIARYLQAARPQLVYDERTREVARALLAQKQSLAMTPFVRLVFEAAKQLLPDWAARMHGFARHPAARPGVGLGVKSVGSLMRWALRNSAETRARRRAAILRGQADPGPP
jgi:uncharacterized protein (DUF2236 family)